MLLISCKTKKIASTLIKHLLVFAVMMAAAQPAQAQQKPFYYASLEAAWERGGSDKSSAYFVSNGVNFKNVSAGFGVGLDNYAIRSVPLFADVQKQFGHRKIKPFLGASAGINFQHPTDEQKNSYGVYFGNGTFKNGLFTKASAGVSMPVYRKLRVFVNAGYSYKTTAIKYNSYIFPWDGIKNSTTDSYHFNRWFASIGFWLY